jgi:peptide chain release factor subunit 1
MEQYELDDVLESAADSGGAGTWHISLYIRPDKSIQSVQNKMHQEMSEAESIKSDDTRERVQQSLERVCLALSEYSETPENGLILFVSPQEKYCLDELPFECPENRYHCGKEFLTEPIEGGIDSADSYGLVVVERGRAAIGVLDSGRVVNVREIESQVMGKTKAGGQSQARFERERERQKHEFFLDVAETATNTFGGYDARGVVIGGTLDTAKEFSREYTGYDWNVLGTYSVDHGDEEGLSELVERAAKAILDEEEGDIRELVQTFLRGVRDGSAAYGKDEVLRKLERGAVDTLLLSTSLESDEISRLSSEAESLGGETVVIDPSFEEAEMFDNISGGYGALLRW